MRSEYQSSSDLQAKIRSKLLNYRNQCLQVSRRKRSIAAFKAKFEERSGRGEITDVLFTFASDVYSYWCHVASKVILFNAMHASSRHCADYAFVRLGYINDNLVRYFADCTSIEVQLGIVPAPGEYSAYSGIENPKPSAFIVNGELRDHTQLRNHSRSRVHSDLDNTAALTRIAWRS
jgi:hypothetical protein